MRLLDKGGAEAFTTNAVAERAGVSIGTLYQYFPNKDAILDALAAREMAEMSRNVIAAVGDDADISPRERIGRIIGAVAGTYGERRRVHRLVLEHSLATRSGRITPMAQQLIALLTSPERKGGAAASLSEADAFVLIHAVIGVMRAMILRADETAPSQNEIEESVSRLVIGFMGAGAVPTGFARIVRA